MQQEHPGGQRVFLAPRGPGSTPAAALTARFVSYQP